LKILHVIPSYAPAFQYGGTIVSSEGLCRAQKEEGHEVSVFTTNLNGSEVMDYPAENAVDRYGVQVHYFPVNAFFNKLSRRLYFSLIMKQHLKATIANYDVVHLHSVFLYPTAIAAKYARKAGVPYVVSPRGMLVKELIKSKSSFIKRAWIRLFERRTIKHSAIVHFTSQREYLDAKALNFQFKQHAVIANGVDCLTADLQTKSHNAQALPYILYLGRINWKKGLDKLIRAFADSQSSKQAELIIVGNDDEGCKASLVDLAEELEVTNKVVFKGFVEGEEKQLLLNNATALALCSINENFGNVVLEALASGTPAIVTEGVGASSIVDEFEAGIVVSAKGDNEDNSECEAISSALDQLILSPDEAKEMGERGRQAVKNNYSWNSIAQNLIEQYSQIRRQD